VTDRGVILMHAYSHGLKIDTSQPPLTVIRSVRRLLRMRVWHISWEYPPVMFGGLGKHVHSLAEAQVRAGHDVTVVTLSQDPRPGHQSLVSPFSEIVNGVRVERVALAEGSPRFGLDNLLSWVSAMQSAMKIRAHSLHARTGGSPEIVHAHDWLVSEVALELGHSIDIPVVATMHATERGRHQGWLPTPLSKNIDDREKSLVHSAHHVITCSQFMADEVTASFALDPSHLTVIPNGSYLDPTSFRSESARLSTHERTHERIKQGIYADPLLVFCGRLEWEKGAQTLIEALPEIRRQVPGTEVVIAGQGSQAQSWRQLATDTGVDPYVHFTGWLSEESLHALVSAADALVVPSLYEPFGLVVLEGAALGTALVVARTGGLCEFVEDGVTGLSFTPGNAQELTSAVVRVLSDSGLAESIITAARKKLGAEYDWDAIAARTMLEYQSVTEGIYNRAQ